ncbi:hypothetical protein IG631_05435 [Alternaria alternata]|nr:hypothetical protein IG631_05435 [Alternaria alternata]
MSITKPPIPAKPTIPANPPSPAKPLYISWIVQDRDNCIGLLNFLVFPHSSLIPTQLIDSSSINSFEDPDNWPRTAVQLFTRSQNVVLLGAVYPTGSSLAPALPSIPDGASHARSPTRCFLSLFHYFVF